MRSFGQYHALRPRDQAGRVWSARKGEESADKYVVKYVEIADCGEAASQAMLRSADLQRKAADGSVHWAPIYASGVLDGVAYYVTDHYRWSAAFMLESLPRIDRKILSRFVTAVVRGLVDYQRTTGLSHGNLKPTNILLTSPNLQDANGKIVLTDPEPQSAKDAEPGRDADRHALGRLIFHLVFGFEFNEGLWPLQPSPRWKILGEDADVWRAHCNGLLAPAGHPDALDVARLAEELSNAEEPISQGGRSHARTWTGIAAFVLCAAGTGWILWSKLHPIPPPPPLIHNTLIQFDSGDFVYNGNPQTPGYTVFNADDHSTISAPSPTVNYTDGNDNPIPGAPTEAGNYSITVNFPGDRSFSGSKNTAGFKIDREKVTCRLIVPLTDIDLGSTTVGVKVQCDPPEMISAVRLYYIASSRARTSNPPSQPGTYRVEAEFTKQPANDYAFSCPPAQITIIQKKIEPVPPPPDLVWEQLSALHRPDLRSFLSDLESLFPIQMALSGSDDQIIDGVLELAHDEYLRDPSANRIDAAETVLKGAETRRALAVNLSSNWAKYTGLATPAWNAVWTYVQAHAADDSRDALESLRGIRDADLAGFGSIIAKVSEPAARLAVSAGCLLRREEIARAGKLPFAEDVAFLLDAESACASDTELSHYYLRDQINAELKRTSFDGTNDIADTLDIVSALLTLKPDLLGQIVFPRDWIESAGIDFAIQKLKAKDDLKDSAAITDAINTFNTNMDAIDPKRSIRGSFPWLDLNANAQASANFPGPAKLSSEESTNVPTGDPELAEYTLTLGPTSYTLYFRKVKTGADHAAFVCTTIASVGMFIDCVDSQPQKDQAERQVWGLMHIDFNDLDARSRYVDKLCCWMPKGDHWIQLSDDWLGGDSEEASISPPGAAKPTLDSPMQYVTPAAASYVASLLKCRLPSEDEWDGAQNAQSAGQSPLAENLRGKNLANFVKNNLLASNDPYVAQALVLRLWFDAKGYNDTDFLKALTQPQSAQTGGLDPSEVLWFRPIGLDTAPSKFRDFGSNISQWVWCPGDDPSKNPVPDAASTSALRPFSEKFERIGRSIIWPFNDDAHARQRLAAGVYDDFIDRFPDVGFRLAYDVIELTPYEQVKNLRYIPLAAPTYQ